MRVLITGASRGIGAAFARLVAGEGHIPILTARQEGDLAALAAETGGIALPFDLADPSAPDALWNEAGQIDILINNAGLGGGGPFADPEGWSREAAMIDVNIRAATHLAKRAMVDMAGRGTGGILNVASLAGVTPGPNMAIYYASKAYLLNLSEALHVEGKGLGVTVTALCPGPVDTGFFTAAGLKPRPGAISAETVARAGWEGLAKGRSRVIPGAGPKALALAASALPRSVLLRIMARDLARR